MLAKSKRLNLKKSYRWVAGGKSLNTPNFRIMYRLGDNSTPLVGIALSSQNFKKAHLRNRARRLTSEAVKECYSELIKNINLVIMPRAGVLEKSPQELKEEIKGVVINLR